MPRPIAVLTSTTDKLQAYGSGAAATTNPTVTVLYHDIPQQVKTDFSEYRYGRQYTVLDGTTETDILDAPTQGVVRVVDRIVVYNADTANFTVFVTIDDNTTNRIQVRKTLATLESLVGDEDGWDAVTGVFATGVTSGQVLYSSSGVATGSTSLTFSGSTLTAHTLTVSTGALTGVTGAFSGTITSTKVGSDGGFAVTPVTGTNAAWSSWNNTGNTSYFGIESSAGGAAFVGSSAYATVLGTVSARSLQFFTNNALRATIDSGGATTLAGTLTVSGTTVNMVESGTTLTVGVGADNGTVSAGVFTDRTKYFVGDALTELCGVVGSNGEIDHSTLPRFAMANVKRDIMGDIEREVEKKIDGGVVIERVTERVKVGEETVTERDLGAMISMLTVAVKQLSDKLNLLEGKLTR